MVELHAIWHVFVKRKRARWRTYESRFIEVKVPYSNKRENLARLMRYYCVRKVTFCIATTHIPGPMLFGRHIEKNEKNIVADLCDGNLSEQTTPLMMFRKVSG